MPYKQRLDRELEPELFLISAIYGEIPNLHEIYFPLHRLDKRRVLLQSIRGFYDSLNPQTLDYFKSSEIRERVTNILSTLSEREQKVLHILFGFQNGIVYTYEEAAKFIPRIKSRYWWEDYLPNEPVTRERIRQIEVKALRRLRHPSRSHELRSYLKSLAENRK